MDVRLPDGRIVTNVPESMTQGELVRVLKKNFEWFDLTEGMSGTEKFMAGAGKAVSDIGTGAKQLGGEAVNLIAPSVVSDESVAAMRQGVDETRRRDAPLMETGAGFGGNVAGNIAGLVLPGMGLSRVPGMSAIGRGLMTPTTALSGAGAGATFQAVQPVGTQESRPANMLGGAAFGAAVPLVFNTAGILRRIPQPLTEKGQERIAGKLIRGVIGEQDIPAVSARLAQARPLVPGSIPTAAEVGESGGLAAIQRAMTQELPEEFATRGMQQAAARRAALEGIAKTPAQLAAAEEARGSVANALYGQARALGPDPVMAQVLKPQIANLIERMPRGVLSEAKELARVEGQTFNKAGSIGGLHYVKKAIDQRLDTAAQTGLGPASKRALTEYKGDLLTVIDDLSPTYAKGREAFAKMSPEIKRMEVGQYLLEKMRPALAEHGALARETGATYAGVLRGAEETAKKATGFAQPLEKIMTPQEMQTLNALAADFARKANAQELGRGVGSNTFQNLSMQYAMGGGRESVLPNLLYRPSMIVNFVARQIYGHADDEIRKRVAQALLTPQGTLDLINKATPAKHALIVDAVRRVATPMMATLPGQLNAPQ